MEKLSSYNPLTNHTTAEIGLISASLMKYVYTINMSIIVTFISLFGIVTNTINIVIFKRQGFRETINISLFGLAISDLCSLITLLWVSICFYPVFMNSSLPFMTIEVQYISGSWSHVIFTRITGFITVFITLERCLCVVFPLKVKAILTPKRVTFIILGIYAFTIGSMTHLYVFKRVAWKFVPHLNRSMIGLVTYGGPEVLTVTNVIQLVNPLMTFPLVVCFTIALVYSINRMSKWREGVSKDIKNNVKNNSNTESFASMRDRQVIKMAIYVALIFIVTFIPSIVMFTVFLSLPGVSVGYVNENLFNFCLSFSFIVEAFNSSVNIFVYYKMSSKFKAELKSCLSSKK